MRGAYNRQSIRIAASIMTVVIPLMMIFSVFFIAYEADHDCHGEDCPICESIEQCEDMLHQIGGGFALQAVALIPVIICIYSVSAVLSELMSETLISRKVRLNN